MKTGSFEEVLSPFAKVYGDAWNKMTRMILELGTDEVNGLWHSTFEATDLDGMFPTRDAATVVRKIINCTPTLSSMLHPKRDST